MGRTDFTNAGLLGVANSPGLMGDGRRFIDRDARGPIGSRGRTLAGAA